MTDTPETVTNPDPLDAPIPHPLLGRHVTVTLDRDNPDAVLRGVLVELDAGGGVTVDTEQGRRSGWPALDIVEAPDTPSPKE